MHHFWQKISLGIVSILVCVFGLELGLRVFELVWSDIPFSYSVADYEDRVLGWEGKQIFGDPKTDKFKIFVLGDSFTEAGLLNETEIYYQALKNQPNIELFVYASAGYGTLQEYLALDRYVDEIQPDLIILQITANDIINNSLTLESKSFANNNLYLRPYLINNQVELKFPSRLGLARFVLTKYSRLGYRSFTAWDKIAAGLAKQGLFETVETQEQQEKHAAEYAEAEKITQDLLAKMHTRGGSTKIVFLPATINHPELNQLIKGRIDDKYWLDEPAKKIATLAAQGYSLHEPDHEHWNAAGHKIVGEMLWQELIANNFVVVSSQSTTVSANSAN